MTKWLHAIWALAGRVIYRVVGVVALPIFLNGTRRTRVALIDREKGTILLAKVWIGKQEWVLLGGDIDKSEDMFVAAVREVREETGYDLDQSKLDYIGEITIEEYMATYEAHVFIAYVDEFEPKPPKYEILDVCWHKLNKLPKDHHNDTINMVKSELK